MYFLVIKHLFITKPKNYNYRFSKLYAYILWNRGAVFILIMCLLTSAKLQLLIQLLMRKSQGTQLAIIIAIVFSILVFNKMSYSDIYATVVW